MAEQSFKKNNVFKTLYDMLNIKMVVVEIKEAKQPHI